MQNKQRHLLLPAVFSAGSFLCLTLCALLSDPLSNVMYIVIFFTSLFIFFVSGGYLAVYLRKRQVSAKARYRIFIFSILTLIVLMFLSAESLSLIDFLILILIAFGLLFYGSRRVS
jgi:hypothetical protein